MSEEQNKKRKVFESDNDLGCSPPLHNLLIKKHSEKALVPTRGSPLAAGYDLYRSAMAHLFSSVPVTYIFYSAEKKVIPARGKAVIDTQISIAVPPGTYGRVAPRSGLGKGVTS